MVTHRYVWSTLSLLLGWLPLLLIFLGAFYIITGPTAIFAGIWGWRKPGSLVQGRRRWAAVLGILGGLIQLAAVGFVVLGIWKNIEERSGARLMFRLRRTFNSC